MNTPTKQLLRVAPLELLADIPPLLVVLSLAMVAAVFGTGAYVLLFYLR